jgi:putative PIN family toxin of toxin-antitoxin system
MRVLADTNILISALLFPASLPARALLHVASTHELVLCDHIIEEMREVITRKRPDLLQDVDVLLAHLSYEMAVVQGYQGKRIQDPKDQPILNAAIAANVDIIISGDKHFLRLDLERPKTMSAADFCRLEQI